MMTVQSTTINPTFNVSWFNIEDLRSEEIDHVTDRVKAIGDTIQSASQRNGYEFPEILALGELTYDEPTVPNDQCTTDGENLVKLSKTFPVELPEKTDYTFSLANIGLNAQRTPSGDYLETSEDPDAVNEFGDLVNYGLFPGQYNTGFISSKPVVDLTMVKNLKWKDFNPNVDPTQWKDASGKPIPEDCQLFDKLFMDITVDIDGSDVHFIVLHTVPATGFGNPNTPNLQRNKDQLAFLQWYLSGQTYFTVPEDLKENGQPITPLSERDVQYFIAMGDWNADYRDKECPGSSVLRSLFETYAWFPSEGITNRDPSGSFEGILDYMVWPKTITCINQYVSPINEKVSDHGAINATFMINPDAKNEGSLCAIL
jgi:Endonuclease/Exonuclease/phosphatase family